MTIATEIATITDYNSTDISNAVTEATSFCAMHDVTDDEIIKSAAIWLLERQTEERQHYADPTVTIREFMGIHDLIERLKGKEVDTSVALFTSYKSPNQKNKSPFSW